MVDQVVLESIWDKMAVAFLKVVESKKSDCIMVCVRPFCRLATWAKVLLQQRRASSQGNNEQQQQHKGLRKRRFHIEPHGFTCGCCPTQGGHLSQPSPAAPQTILSQLTSHAVRNLPLFLTQQTLKVSILSVFDAGRDRCLCQWRSAKWSWLFAEC